MQLKYKLLKVKGEEEEDDEKVEEEKKKEDHGVQLMTDEMVSDVGH